MDLNSCVICLTEILNSGLKLDCGHSFHKPCILDFVKSERRRLEELYHETDDELRPQLDLVILCSSITLDTLPFRTLNVPFAEM